MSFYTCLFRKYRFKIDYILILIQSLYNILHSNAIINWNCSLCRKKKGIIYSLGLVVSAWKYNTMKCFSNITFYLWLHIWRKTSFLNLFPRKRFSIFEKAFLMVSNISYATNSTKILLVVRYEESNWAIIHRCYVPIYLFII